jgi:hypothetical protein
VIDQGVGPEFKPQYSKKEKKRKKKRIAGLEGTVEQTKIM